MERKKKGFDEMLIEVTKIIHKQRNNPNNKNKQTLFYLGEINKPKKNKNIKKLCFNKFTNKKKTKTNIMKK